MLVRRTPITLKYIGMEQSVTTLTDMFSLDKTSLKEKITRLNTPHVATFCLQQHQLLFDVLMGDEIIKRQALSLLLSPACKGKL